MERAINPGRGMPGSRAPAPDDNHRQWRPRDSTEQVKSLPTCDRSTAIRYCMYLLPTALSQKETFEFSDCCSK